MSIIDKDVPYGPLPLADRMAAVWTALGEEERETFIDDVARSDNPTLTVYAWEQTLAVQQAETSHERPSCTGGCRCGGSCN